MIVRLADLPLIRKKFIRKKIVFAGGTFDLFHRGHIESFKNLRKYGDCVVISVMTDRRVRERKGPKRPILPQKDRLALVDAIRYVDYTVLAPEPSKNQPGRPTMTVIEKLRPDIFISVDRKWGEFRANIEKNGTKLKIIPRGNINSTTRLIKKILIRHK